MKIHRHHTCSFCKHPISRVNHLIEIDGRSMISAASLNKPLILQSVVHDVLVATDDERIFNHVDQSFGYQVVMTSSQIIPVRHGPLSRSIPKHQDSKADAIINIQGDEPFVDPSQIDLLANLISKPECRHCNAGKTHFMMSLHFLIPIK
jgi:3-deoxy-manno-octulosonate cytidylyltransferase (CMP-KDO synthetase)